MKQLLLLLCVLLGTSVMAMASITCPVSTYDKYMANLGLGCTIGDKTFFNWSYSSSATGGAALIPPSGIAVTPITTPNNPGVLFSSGFGVTSNQTQDEFFDFTVRVNLGGHAIDDITLLQLGSGFTGTGSASIAETVCLGDTFADGCLHGKTRTLLTVDNNTQVTLIDHITFAPVLVVDVVKDLELFGGPNGSAFVSGVENQFSEVTPEPSTLLMLGTGVVGLAGILRRKQNKLL
jgi:PEP-CTERM motif